MDPNRCRSSILALVLTQAALADLGCIGDSAPQDTEELARTSDAVWDGPDHVLDSANKHDYVAYVTTGGGGLLCTGVLVTPFWMVTSSHCFSTAASRTSDISATFHVDPAVASKPETRNFTFSANNPIFLRITDPNPADINHVAQDLAAFRLDTRVPAWVARPKHLSLIPNTCPAGFGSETGFTGTAVGYGTTWAATCGPISLRRRYSTHDGWFRFGTVDGAIYEKTFVNSPAFCSEYSGVAFGDSGGPLIDEAGNLCGLAGSFGGPVPGPTLLDYYTVNNYTALDSPESVAWLLSLQTPNGDRLVDDEGNFDGECEKYLESCDEGECDDHDADADGVVDLCDACPFVPNVQDTDEDNIPDCTDPCPSHPREPDAPACDQGGDFDCDGICDGFDNCPYTPNFGQENANADAEAAWIDDSTLASQEMGDACEPVPVPASEPLAVERIASQGVSSSFFTDVVSLNVQDGIRVRPLRSRRTKLSKSGTVSYQPVGVPTHFRYCQYLASGEPGLQCDDPALISSDEVHYELASANEETDAMRWHRVTMSNLTTNKS